MTYIKGILFQFISVLFIFVLASFPLVFLNSGGNTVFQAKRIFILIKQFLVGLFTGESYLYIQGDRTRFLFEDLGSYFLASFLYLLAAGLIILIIGFVLGIWLWKNSEKFFNKIFGFLGILPDFVFILLLQLFVIFIYQQTGIKVAKVASFSNDESAVVLPLISLIMIPLLYVIRTLNEKTKDVLTQDYILTAISKGLSKKQIYTYHVTTNVTPFFKADLHKIVSIMISNLFIVEYLFNLRGLTSLLFETAATFQYQYNLVIFCLFAIFLLYGSIFFLLKGIICLVERIVIHV
ncbi:ABC transporter permease subunit [Niallia sp. 03133]|uniref:ABC transporter permease subunit n=1 Tax=Niallia sp. 03133 TaxID=3458060 RepID=UPI004043DDCF